MVEVWKVYLEISSALCQGHWTHLLLQIEADHELMLRASGHTKGLGVDGLNGLELIVD